MRGLMAAAGHVVNSMVVVDLLTLIVVRNGSTRRIRMSREERL
jgi:hypothetical protein